MMSYKRKSSRELCGMGQGALLMYAQDLQIEIERLERELTECKARFEQAISELSECETQKVKLAAQVMQMREALGAIATYPHKPDDVKRWADEAIALDTPTAEQIIAKVKAEALR